MNQIEETIQRVRIQAIEQRIHGDSYMHIGAYLDRSGISQEERKQIILEIKDLENSKMLKKQLPKGTKYVGFSNGLMALIVISLGVFIWVILRDKGFVSLLPIGLIIYGLFSLNSSFFKRKSR